MEGQADSVARPNDPFGRALFFLSYLLALAGGFVMVAMAAMTVVSVLGRWLVSKPIFGDFELVQIGTATAVFLFLPYCQMKRGNVLVDLFLARAPQKLQSACDVVASLILAVIGGLLAWRLYHGGLDMYNYHEVSYILAIPIWIVFPVGVAGAVLLGVCSLYMALADFMRIFR